MQAPIYDVPTAAEVLETGSYPLLPAAISELRPAPPPKPSERAEALRLMDQHIRTQLLQVCRRCGARYSGAHQSHRAAGKLRCCAAAPDCCSTYCVWRCPAVIARHVVIG